MPRFLPVEGTKPAHHVQGRLGQGSLGPAVHGVPQGAERAGDRVAAQAKVLGLCVGAQHPHSSVLPGPPGEKEKPPLHRSSCLPLGQGLSGMHNSRGHQV